MALYDVSYAVTRRPETPLEQHVHSFLEVLPFMAISFVVCLYWGQARALVGLGDEPADLGLRLKDPTLPGSYLTAVVNSVLVFLGLPYGEKVWRCYRAARRASAPADKSASVPG